MDNKNEEIERLIKNFGFKKAEDDWYLDDKNNKRFILTDDWYLKNKNGKRFILTYEMRDQKIDKIIKFLKERQ